MAVLAAALLLALSANASTVPVRGVILISLDTVRGDRLDKMPELSQWAKGGVVFERAFTEGTWTLPAHASLLTGLYPASHGAGGLGWPNSRRVAELAPRLAELLRRDGFATAGIFGVDVIDRPFGFAEGFDVYEHDRFDGHVEDGFSQARGWLSKRGRGKFFLFLHSFAAHRYLIAKSGLETCRPTFDFGSTPHFDRSDDPRCEGLRKDYDLGVACLDGQLGGFLRWLDESGLGREALVIVTSDHGEAICGGHLREPPLGHGFPPYDDLAHVLMIARWPDGSFAGRREEGLIQHVDLMPMILESAGLRVPPGLDGRSPLAALRGGSSWPRREVYLEEDTWTAVRTPSLKLISYSDGAKELYDVAADTVELREVSATRPAEASALLARLGSYIARGCAGVHLRPLSGRRVELSLRSPVPLSRLTAFATGPGDRWGVDASSTSAVASLERADGRPAPILTFDAPASSGTYTLSARADGGPERSISFVREKLPVGLPRENDAPVEVWRSCAWEGRASRAQVSDKAREALRAEGYLP